MAEINMKWGHLDQGFFRYDNRIYFATPHGKWVFYFPVKDGKICRSSGVDCPNICPGEEISVIPIQDMVNHGMKIGEGDNPLRKKFWS